jgi:hypothetical protein
LGARINGEVWVFAVNRIQNHPNLEKADAGESTMGGRVVPNSDAQLHNAHELPSPYFPRLKPLAGNFYFLVLIKMSH